MTNAQHDHSRWGAADQIGAGNLLTVERRLAAPHAAKDGRVYDLSHEIGMNAPFMMPNLLSRFFDVDNSRCVGTFCFILLATKYKGATGCPVRPVALV